MLIVSISLRFARLGHQISCSFQESMAETFISFLPFSPQLNIRKSKRCLHLLLLTPWILLKRAVQPSSVIHCRQSWSIWRFSWCFFDCLGLSFSLSPFPNVLFPLFCPRHLWKALPAQLCGSGDVSLQDLHPSRTAQPCLQGNFHLPSCPLPALWCHANDLHIQQTQHEAQRDDRLDFHGSEQQWRRRAKSLAGNEGIERDAGLQVAHTTGVLVVTRAAWGFWDYGLSSLVLTQQKTAIPGKHRALRGHVCFNLTSVSAVMGIKGGKASEASLVPIFPGCPAFSTFK